MRLRYRHLICASIAINDKGTTQVELHEILDYDKK